MRDRPAPAVPQGKKAQILAALIGMLDTPGPARVTTAALAEQLGQSEAALYRHFASKSALFEALIEHIEALLFEDLLHIEATEPNGRLRLRKQLHALLHFSDRNHGLTRVLTGEALATEHPALLERLNVLFMAVQDGLQRSAELAIGDGSADSSAALCAEGSAMSYANLLATWAQGCWHRQTQTGWAVTADDYERQFALLGL